MFITHKFIKIHSIKLEVFYFFLKFFIVFYNQIRRSIHKNFTITKDKNNKQHHFLYVAEI